MSPARTGRQPVLATRGAVAAPHHAAAQAGLQMLQRGGSTRLRPMMILRRFALMFGLTDMATIPFSATATAEMFGPRMLGMLTGLLAVAHQCGSALGSFLTGWGYEVFGGYPPVIIGAVGVALTAALLAFAMDTRRVPVGTVGGDAGLAPSGA